MEGLVEQVEELRGSLQSLLITPTDPLILQNATHCALELGTDLINTKVALDTFPFESILGRNGVVGDLQEFEDLLFNTEATGLLQNIIRILRHILGQYSAQVKRINLFHLQGLVNTLYVKNPTAKLKVEALKLMECYLPILRDQQITKKNKNVDDDVDKIFNRYYKEFTKTSKLSPTLQAQVKIVLGKMIQIFPDILIPTGLPDKLLHNYIDYISTTVRDKSGKKLDLTLLEGTLTGLDLIIEGLGFNLHEDAEALEKLYEALKKICKLPDQEADVKRRGAMRQGLALFSRHSNIFSKIILRDVNVWYTEIRKWREQNNKDDRVVGQKSMSALFQAVNHGLEEAAPNLGESMPLALKSLVDKFNVIMQNSEALSGTKSQYGSKDISLAIQGYGVFSKLLAKYLSAEQYQTLCLEIVSCTERFHIEADEGTQEKWRNQFHAHVKSIGNLVAALDAPSPPLLHSLESLCLHLVRKYPFIPYQFHTQTNSALISVLDSCPKEVGPLLDNLVYHGLVESCSYPAVPEHQILPPEVISYKKYIPLWLGLLKKENKNRENIFDAYMSSFIEIIDKLDLSIIDTNNGDTAETTPPSGSNFDDKMNISLTQNDSESEFGMVSSKLDLDRVTLLEGKRARVCKDYTILVNIVDLSLAVIDNATDLVKGWIKELWRKVSTWSYQYPDASRFYTLITKLVTLISFKYDCKDDLTLSIQQFYSHHFTRMTFFDQTELRIAAYSLVANIPVQIVKPLLRGLPKAVEKVLELSKTVPELGNKMLKTIRNILEDFPASELNNLLRTVMPNLRIFLSWRPTQTDNKEIKKFKSGPLTDKPKKIGEKLHLQNLEEENCKIALDILTLVPSEYKELALLTPEELGEQLTVWDTRDHLTVEVPLPDVLLPVHLDSLLPSIIDLAQQMADRKARVAAGEALHALLLLMIGRTSQQTDDMANKAPMTELFKRVFPVVLKLAGDSSDSVIQGLFQPLFSQMIHWFTKDSKRGSSETECLLECLINTICSSKDMELKQEAGSYLQEFVVWSIKQSKTNSTGNANIKSLLNRLYFLLRHPNVNKRLGGCVVFTHIYRIFREDKNLVSDYLFEILASFFQCLKISESDPPFSATVPECEKNLAHLKRILLHYLATFQVESSSRRVPVNMANSSSSSKGTLSNLQSWLLDFMTAVEHPAARRAALVLFNDLCQATGASVRRVLESKYGSINQMLEVILAPIRMLIAEESSKAVLRLGPMDYTLYCAVFELALWLLGTSTCEFEEIKQVEDFVSSFIRRFSLKEEEIDLKKNWIDGNGAERSTCILRFWMLMTSLIKSGHANNIIKGNKGQFHDTIIPVLMESDKHQFLFKKAVDKDEFINTAISLLKALKDNMADYYSKLVLYFFKVYLAAELFSFQQIRKSCVSGKADKYILHVYTKLAQHKVLIENVDTENLLNDVIENLPNNVIELNNMKQDTIQNLKLYVGLISLLNQNTNDTTENLICNIARSTEPNHIWFINAFGGSFISILINHINSIVDYYISNSNGSIHDVFIMFAKFVKGGQNGEHNGLFLDSLFKHWPMVVANSTSRSSTLKVIHLVRKVSDAVEMKHAQSGLIVKWFSNVLKNGSLHLKIKYKALQLLCIVLKLASQDEIKDALEGFSYCIPTFSSELVENTVQYDLYIMIFKQLLASLEASKSTGLFYFVISVVCKDDKNICKDKIYDSITKMLVTERDVDKQLQLLQVPYNIFSDETGVYSFQAKLSAVTQFVVPGLQASSPMAVRRFFTNNIEFMLTQLKTELTGNEDKKSKILVKLIGIVQLLGVMYSKLEAAMVHTPGGIVSQKAATIIREKNLIHIAQANGKEMTTYLLRFLVAARSWQADQNWSKGLKRLLREFHSHSLNSCIAIISCTNTNEKIYNNYIFMEKKGSPELIWNRIMDTEKTIKLEFIFDKALSTRKDYVGIKNSYNDLQYLMTSASQQFHYLSDSSLSQDVSRYDYTGTMSQAVSLQDRQAENNESENSSAPGSYINIEEDEFGESVCLSQLVAVANFMQANKIYTEPSDNFDKVTAPGWMASILTALQDKQSHRNSKLFILSFIFKCSDIFSPFSIRFYKIVLECIVDGVVCPDGKLNYLAMDLILMLLSWSEQTGTQPSSEDNLVTKLLSLLMKNVVYPEDVKVFKVSMELVSVVVQKWRQCLSTGSSFAYLQDLLVKQDDDTMQKGARYLISVFLAQDYKDYQIITDINFVKRIIGKSKAVKDIDENSKLQGFYSKSRDVYQKSGVCIGLLLKAVQDDSDSLEAITKVVADHLNQLCQVSTAEGKSRFLLILYGVQKGYPTILEDYASRFKYSLKSMNDDDLHLCLEMLETHTQCQLIKQPDCLKTELNMIGLSQFLKSYEPSVKLLALNILKVCHLQINPELSSSYYDDVKLLLTSKYLSHRKVCIEMMKERYNSNTECSDNLTDFALTELIKALNDKDEDFRSDVFNFLNTTAITKVDSFDRLIQILTKMRCVDTSVLTFLASSLLKQGEQLPTFRQNLFSAPLDQCQFREYSVDTSWRSQFAGTLMPLFADSLASQSQVGSQGSRTTGSFGSSASGTNMLRATQANYSFSQTQGNPGSFAGGGGGGRAGQLLAGSLPQAGANTTPSTLLQADIARKTIKVGSLEGGRRYVRDYGSNDEQVKKFSKLAERNKVRMLNMEEDRRKSQEKNVRLMRKYRTGDLPDIQILVSDLMRPILALGQYSLNIASALCADIIQGVITSNEELMTEEWKAMFKTCMNRILETGCGDNKILAETVLNICLVQADFLEDGLDIKQIAKVATKHGLTKYGVLILEKFYTQTIIDPNKFVVKQDCKRAKLNDDESRINLTISLVDLLKSEGEYENVKGLLRTNSTALNIHSLTEQALNEESTMNWSKAIRTYRKLLDDEKLVDSHYEQEVTLWHKGYYDSMCKLGLWEKVDEEIATKFGTNIGPELWDLPYADSVIGGWLNSSLHLGENSKGSIYQFINHLSQDKSNPLEKKYPFQLAIISAEKKKFDAALRLTKQAIAGCRLKLFQENASNGSTAGIHYLQGLLELVNYLGQIQRGHLDTGTAKLWKECEPSTGRVNLTGWDSILTTRRLLINKLSPIQMETDEDPDQSKMSLKKALAKNYGNLAFIAVKAKNPKYAERGLKCIKALNIEDGELKSLRRSISSKVAAYNNGRRDNVTAVDCFCKVFQQLTKTNMDTCDVTAPDVKDLYQCLYEIVDLDGLVRPSSIRRHLQEKELSVFDGIFENISDCNDDLKEQISLQVLNYFMSANKLDKRELMDDLMQGSNFTHKLWKKNKDDSNSLYAQLSVRYQLRAMELGSVTGRQMFPRCLDLVNNDDTCQLEFKDACQKVPVWMFLPWRNQLMSCLDTLNATFAPLLTRMVEEYPHALAYQLLAAISISHELSDEALNTIYRLKELCSSYPMYESLVSSMKYLAHPAILIKDLASSIQHFKKEFPSSYQHRIKQEYEVFKEAYIANNQRKGLVFTSFFSDKESKLDKIISKCDAKDLNDISIKSKQSIKGKYSLKDLSPFLADFLASNQCVQVEVPGQYDSFAQPDPEQHVFLSSFTPGVSVFHSIRKPMLITMLGSDGKKYPFIAKAGEDIRVDQRIENLFAMCNVCVAGGQVETGTGTHTKAPLLIKTYNVIPLSDKLGLIEFVNKSSPVMEFLEVGKNIADIRGADERYIQGMKKMTRNSTDQKAFVEGAKLRKVDIVTNYESAVGCTDTDHLRCALSKLSSGHMQFYLMRQNFVTSYAVVSAMQWILGIGDRHLSNYLICKRTASIVPIDFGHSFGSGTSSLEIPELVQLRLSPQIQGVLEPSQANGLFRETMVQVLNILRDNSEMLMATLDVFVKEPTLDWQRIASTLQKKKGAGVDTNFAKQRIEVAKSKLAGGHPSNIMVQELKSGKPRDGMENLIKCITRDRLHIEKQGLSSIEQVDVLMNQSLDPNLLGRMWWGWRPYA